MGCGSCTKNGLPKGCRNNGSCGVKGCEQLTVFDWLSDVSLPANQKIFDCVEVRFKNGRKDFYRNVNELKLYMGDVVTVEGTPGHDVGVIAMKGELVRIRMRSKNQSKSKQAIKKLYRKANQRDIDLWQQGQKREEPTMIRTRQIVKELKLDMKISDVEFQADNNKAIFFYIADGRVDFRELIRVLASEFKIRVEMKQIGSRQEAGRVGGIGSCGRELCCSTWLTDFRSVSTSAARYQQLSLNPQKLAGQCGKLKCCLNFELDSYLDALKDFPDSNISLKTMKGEARFQKMDIFKNLMWYAYDDGSTDWIALPVKVVHKIQKMNERDEVPESLEVFLNINEKTPAYTDVVGQERLDRFDKNKGKGRSKRKGKRPYSKNNNRNKNARS